MARRISPEKIEEIRLASDIVDVVSGYLTLRRRGKNFFGLCPFHTEKTPSFSVNPEMQIFRCFGCGAGGNVFHFLMRMEGLAFPEAVRLLAERAGISVEEEESSDEEAREREALYFANKFAADFYRDQLLDAGGKHALNYLRDRGFSDETIRRFQLGFAPDRWDGLLEQAHIEKLPDETLQRAGLIIARDTGGYYDRFRNRVVFPIFNLSGRVMGFGARRMAEDESSPKYINSPETVIYQKGSALYGLYQSREAVRKRDYAVVVEGYTDLISLHQAGIENVVATLGTALTAQQARLIRRYTTHVVLFYDSDSPGFAAALRGAEVMMENDLDVRVAAVPEGHDPDSFVRHDGGEGVMTRLDQADSLFEFRLQKELEAVDLSQPDAKVEVARRVLASASHVRSRLERAAWVSWIADRLRMDERVLMGELDRMMRRRHRPISVSEKEKEDSLRSGTRWFEAEKTLVAALLKGRDVAGYVLEGLRGYHLRDARLAEIVSLYREMMDNVGRVDLGDLVGRLEDAWAAEFATQIVNSPEEIYNSQKLVEDCFRTLRLESLDRELAAVQEALRQKERENYDLDQLTRKVVELLQVRRQVERGEVDPREVS